jgi:hypothetical protein
MRVLGRGARVLRASGPPRRATRIRLHVPDQSAQTPAVLTGGRIVMDVYDNLRPGRVGHLTVSGFAPGPGASWLVSITCNGVTLVGSAATCVFSGGSTGWSWPGRFSFAAGNTYSCLITVITIDRQSGCELAPVPSIVMTGWPGQVRNQKDTPVAPADNGGVW